MTLINAICSWDKSVSPTPSQQVELAVGLPAKGSLPRHRG